MTDLSPAAQAMLDAWNNEWSKGSFCHDQRSIAAALRAVADQVVPESWRLHQYVRHELFAIAAELEAQ